MTFVRFIVGVALIVAGASVLAYGPTILLLSLKGNSARIYQWSIHKDVYDHMPKYNPESKPVPISIQEAVAIARQYSIKKYPNWPKLTLQEITLRRIGIDGKDDHWFYWVQFIRIDKNNKSLTEEIMSPETNIVVLMSGKVIEPDHTFIVE